MRVRATRDLLQLSDRQFFAEIAMGLELIVKNVDRLHDAASVLAEADRHHAGRVLSILANEEASKFLILLDAVRCPRDPQPRLRDQLDRFNVHFAKDLYVRACGMCANTPAQLQEYIDNYRDQYYLDGPNEVSWTFRDEITQQREGALYVDYVAHEDGYRWSDPCELERFEFGVFESPCVRTVKRLHAVGIAKPESLAVVSRVWRDLQLTAETPVRHLWSLNHKTLIALEQEGLLIEQPEDCYRWIVSEWQFPMYDLDLTIRKVDPKKLVQLKERWVTDW